MPTAVETRPVQRQETGAAKPRRNRGRMPTKRAINLAAVGVRHINWLAAALGIVLIVATAAAFSKFFVYDRLQTVSAARREAAEVQRRLDEGYERIEAFGELNELYAHYTYSGMTEEELARVDRVAVMELLERVVLPRTSLDAWTLTGNQLTLNIDGGTLQDINLTVQQLMAEELVDYCTVNTATTNSRNASGQEGPESEVITANIVIYLKNPEEASGE